MDSIFTSDTYQSPKRKGWPFIDILFFHSRWGMYIKLIKNIFLKYSKEAKKGSYDDARWGFSSHHLLRIVENFGGKFDIKGMDHLKNKGPFVIIGNHMSSLETFILPGIIVPHMPVTFVVKEKLIKGNVFGHIMRSRNPIIVGRKSPRKDLETVLTQGQRLLKEGTSIIIFPQSTRSAVFDISKFNSLGVKLAIKAGVSVIPVAVKTDFWGDSKIIRGFGPIRRKNTIHFEFGEPIKPEGRGKTEHQQVVDFIQSRLDSWK